jgi:hypothetical protein
MYVIQIFISYFLTGDKKTKGSVLNGSKHYPNSVSCFRPKSKFDLLLSFTNIWTVPHFQRLYLLSLCHEFALHSGDSISTYSFLCVYFYANLLTSANYIFCVFLYGIYMFIPIDLHHQHRPAAEMSHLRVISAPSGFPGHS